MHNEPGRNPYLPGATRQMVWQALEKAIGDATGEPFRCDNRSSVGGGSINDAFVMTGGGRDFFVKTNAAELAYMFEAEAAGLAEIRDSQSLRAPCPVCHGVADDTSYLVLEYIPFGRGGSHTQERLGEQLALMHRSTSAHFGWERDNTIGSTHQPNTQSNDWVRFLCDQRLGFQLRLAQDNGAPGRLLDSGARLLELLPAFFTTHYPIPSLLHGDLWGGNWAADDADRPVIFDPAVYYGDREADLAMTELFGGFSDRFYHAYRNAWPVDAGYATRKGLYNLYHVLNHFNLFDGGYAGQAQDMIKKLLKEVF